MSEFVVERIIAHKKGLDGNYLFYVQWEGYPIFSDNPDNSGTWEKEENVKDLDCYKIYWARMK